MQWGSRRTAGLAALTMMTAALAAAQPAAAQGIYAPAGPMVKARDLHTATALPDGTVLVAAGRNRFESFDSLNTAETYDPATGLFTLTANALAHGRAEHTATLLASGRVLVAGGETQACCTSTGSYGSRPIDSAEVYDPATRAFSSTATPMSTARYNHAATRLADGRVLITGGITDLNLVGFGVTNAADIYDPATDSFTPTGSMTAARYAHVSTLLPDGRVLVAGGGQSSTTAEIYDPSTGLFTPAAPPVAAIVSATAFPLGDGTILIASQARKVQKYDPAAGTFSAMPDSLQDRGYWAARVMLADGRILMADQGSSELYDPATGSSVAAGNPGVGNLFPAAAPLPGGRVLLAGGQTFVPFTFISQSAASVFTPNSGPIAVAGDDRQVSPGEGCLATVTLDGSASTDADGQALTYEWANGGVILGTTAVLPVSLPAGTHTLELTVNDGQSTGTDTVTITVADTTAPVFAAPGPVTLEQAGPDGTLYAPLVPEAADNCDVSPAITIVGIPAGSLFPAGTTTLTYVATDAAGNEAQASAVVTVSDTIAPSLHVPAAMTVEAASASGANVSFAVRASDAVTPAPVVTCAPASGALFPIGATLVQCSAADGSGNTASGSFSVTVLDGTGPAILSITPSQATLWAPNHKMVPVSMTVEAIDAVDPAPACTIDGVTSTDPITGRGDTTAPDWRVTAPLTVELRAERLGNSSGRIYTIKVRCADAAGHVSIGSTIVTVPHDKGKGK